MIGSRTEAIPMRILFPHNYKEIDYMGLKLMTLALCAVTGKRVKLHSTGETAEVTARHEGKSVTFCLHFLDGRMEEVVWSADLQGFCAADDDLDEVDEGVITT